MLSDDIFLETSYRVEETDRIEMLILSSPASGFPEVLFNYREIQFQILILNKYLEKQETIFRYFQTQQ